MGWFDSALSANGIALQEALPRLSDPDTARDSLLNPPNAYRSLGKSNLRDLPPLDQERMIEIALWLYDANPLAHRLVELINDFVVGEGFSYTAADDGVKQVLDEFWDDPVNAWPLKQVERFRQLSLMGEQAYPLFVRKSDGRVRMGYIDPANILRIDVDPINAEIRAAVQMKAAGGQEGLRLPIIHLDEDPRSPTNGLLIGGPALADSGLVGAFYCSINHVSNSARGRSDLLTSFDWLDLYDQFLFGSAERAAAQGDFIWDVTLEGMGPPQMREWLRDNPMPKGAAMRVHNKNVQWQALAPVLHAADTSEQARTIRMQAVLPTGAPEYMLFSGRDANLATAAVQAQPFLKHLSKRQKYCKAVVHSLLCFARDQAILAKRLPASLDKEARAITVEASEVDTKEMQQVATTTKTMSEALVVAEDRQWVTKDEAAQIFRRLAGETGVTLTALPVLPEGEQLVGAIQETWQAYRKTLARLPREVRAMMLQEHNGAGGREWE